AYPLHTGSSWRDPIGRCEVVVDLRRALSAPHLTVRAMDSLPRLPPPDNTYPKYDWAHYPAGTVIYSGPSRPLVSGRTLRFVRTNFRPTAKDDIFVLFGYRLLSPSAGGPPAPSSASLPYVQQYPFN